VRFFPFFGYPITAMTADQREANDVPPAATANYSPQADGGHRPIGERLTEQTGGVD
jgi:hypothetical protein